MKDTQRKHHVMRWVPSMYAAASVLAVALLGCGGGAGESEDGAAQGAATKASGPPRVKILEPEEGATLDGRSVLIVLSAENIELAPAGDARPGTGHHHLFVNVPFVSAAGEPIPAGLPGIIHLGQAQTAHELTNLAAGEYTVIAVIGDPAHRRIEGQVADTVRFRVP